jgi:hypothetical protein
MTLRASQEQLTLTAGLQRAVGMRFAKALQRRIADRLSATGHKWLPGCNGQTVFSCCDGFCDSKLFLGRWSVVWKLAPPFN